MLENNISIRRIVDFATQEVHISNQETQEAAEAGRQTHQWLVDNIQSGYVPRALVQLGITGSILPEKPVKRVITPGLTLSGRVDILTEAVAVEVKNVKGIKGRHILQAVLERVAAGDEVETAAVFLPKTGEAFVIKDGGRAAEDALTVMAENLYHIDRSYKEIERIENQKVKGSGKIDPTFQMFARIDGMETPAIFTESAEWGTKKIILAKTASKWTREFDEAKEEAMVKIQESGNLVKII